MGLSYHLVRPPIVMPIRGLAISDTNLAPPTINPPVRNGYIGAFII